MDTRRIFGAARVRAAALILVGIGVAACDADGGSGGGGGGGKGGGETTTSKSDVTLGILTYYGGGKTTADFDNVRLYAIVSVDNQSDDPIPLGHLPFKVTTDDDLLVQADPDSAGLDLYCSESIELAPGGKKECAIIFYFPKESHPLQITYETETGIKSVVDIPKSPACPGWCTAIGERNAATGCEEPQGLSYDYCMSYCDRLDACQAQYEAWLQCQATGKNWNCVDNGLYYAGEDCKYQEKDYYDCDP